MSRHTFEQLADRFKVTPGGVRAKALLTTHNIATGDLMHIVLEEIAERIPALRAGVLYKSKQLCGQELWSAFIYDGIRRAVGMCVAYLVNSGALPLKLHVTKSGKGPKRYLMDSTRLSVTSLGEAVSY